ncbi:MAG: glutamate--tRNA ligase [Gammaproteobacteria bacterium]
MPHTIPKTRFCPSPTGLMHLGNLRTALFSALLAKKLNGIFLLRIEDTDRLRSQPKFTQTIFEDLRWLGLEWQEGPEHDKGHGPYWQSQRQAIYDHYYQIVLEKGLAYPCFCSEQQLALTRKAQLSAGKPPRYAGTCRNLTTEQIVAKRSQGLAEVLRFRVPTDQYTVFNDLVRGEQRFANNDIGDFIIRRANGTPPFMYSNAIDDALMEVTHTLRGEDHLTNTPRQIMLLQALHLTAPAYGHIPLIVGADGSPLSKRHGSRSVQELREQGYLPEAIHNYMARLGHYYENDAFMDLSQLAAQFSIAALGKSPARFDSNQLLYWQKEAVLHSPTHRLENWLNDTARQLIPSSAITLFLEIIKPNITFPQEVNAWAEWLFAKSLHYDHDQQDILRTAGETFFATALEALEQPAANFSSVSQMLKEKLGVKGKALFQPLRVALTGQLHGPEMDKLFELLGKDRVRNRLQNCLELTEV